MFPSVVKLINSEIPCLVALPYCFKVAGVKLRVGSLKKAGAEADALLASTFMERIPASTNSLNKTLGSILLSTGGC